VAAYLTLYDALCARKLKPIRRLTSCVE